MSNLMKRGLSLLLVLIMCISLLPVIVLDASAANGYVYNWGTRGEVATSLSVYAEDFYESNNASYEILSSYSGGTNKSDVPTSAMYKELQSLMKGQHSYITSYNATKELFQYTDCQNGGGSISSFYSGKSIGPSWDGNWNREHTWPDSKGLGGSDEDDLMMLRPTSTSENSSRGNTAYGKSSGYYNPNGESGGKYDLRGDVARIFLYVYVRWGNTGGSAWGSSGVMESIEVMLEWIEVDPVDTWELGRNDAVESITGTRNVFVDYPELAFLLFGADIPENMTTPSGIGNSDCGHNNYNSGVIFAATCTEKGYTLYTCQTAGCTHSYKSNVVEALGHKYVSGTCTTCGEAEPTTPAKPTYVTEITTGTPYKLGFYSTAKGTEYYFSGAMTGYYGTTDTAYANGVDVYAENTTGGYHLYFNNDSGKKQYINLVLSGTYYNFTYADTATSVFTWDSEKDAFSTTVNGEICYMGTFGTYYTMGVLRSSKYQETDYVARMYTFGDGTGTPDGGDTDETCKHNYSAVVTDPSCTKEGFTTYTCTLCEHSYTGDKVAATGHTYVDNTCTACGAVKSTDTTASEATIDFTDATNRTTFSKTQQIWEQNGIKVTNNKATSQSDVADYKNPARFYMGSELIIEYPGIVKLEIDCTGLDNKYVKGWLNVPAGAEATVSGGIVTVVFATPVDSVTYTAFSAQSRAYSITVYAESENTPSCTHTNTAIKDAVEPTCTENGHTGKTVCLDCEEVLDAGQVIRATKHNWVSADCDTPKTCSKCQATEGDALGHDWIAATTEAPKTCDRCGATEGDKLPGTNPDDNNPGTNPDDNKPNDNTPDDNKPGDDNTSEDGKEPDNGETPDDENPEGDTAPTKDHSQCKTNGWKKFWNSFANFFRRIFTGKKKCVCGDFYE